MTPFNTLDSSSIPPGTFSIFAYLFISTFNLCKLLVPFITTLQDSKAKSTIKSPHLLANLVPTQLYKAFLTSLTSSVSTGIASSSRISEACERAWKQADTTTVGWMFFSRKGLAQFIISPVKQMTEVVPSPTSSSCILANSIKLLAVGCLQSISLNIAWPSFVMTIPPIGSINIFIIDLGPNVVVTMSAMAFAAAMFAYIAFFPRSCSVLLFNINIGVLVCF